MSPSRLGTLVVSVAAGALPALAFPEADLWWLGHVGLVPLLLMVCAAPSVKEGGLRAWFGGAGFFLAAHHWLLPKVGPFALPLAFLLGALWLLWGCLAWRLLRPPVTPVRLVAALVVVPSAWVTVEALRSWEHLGGPWALLGTSQWRTAPVLAFAAWGGVWGLSLVMVAVNVALAVAVGPRTGRALRAGALAAALGVLAAAVALGALGPRPTPPGAVAVAVVQPGRVEPPAVRFQAHEVTTGALAGSGARLVVWGESSVGFDPDAHPEYVERVARLAAAVGADVLVNVDARRGPGGIFKTSLLVAPDGARDRYDKVRLVPFGEYIPLRSILGWVSGVTEAAAEDRRRGSRATILRSGVLPPAGPQPHLLAEGGDPNPARRRELRIGPLVCFESAFPDLARQLAARGADVIVVQSATTTFQGSWAQPQHASLAAVRAVETGRPVVHAAVSGVSAVFDARGRRLAWLDSDRRGSVVVRIPLTMATTPYVRFGDWPVYTSMAVVAGTVLVWGLVAARRGRAGTPPYGPPTAPAPGSLGPDQRQTKEPRCPSTFPP